MKKITDAYFFSLKILVACLLLLMIALVFGNVVLRYGFNSGIIVSEELSRWCFVWLIFLSAIIAFRENQHLGFDTIFTHLPQKLRRIVEFIGLCLMLFITWLIISGSWTLVMINNKTVAPASNLSLSYFYFSGVFFGVSSGVLLLIKLAKVAFARPASQ